MPVYIFEENALEKIIEVEGERYRRFSTEKEFQTCSFEAFLKKWNEDCKDYPEIINYRPCFGISVEGNGAIYGWGGWNRYILYNSGEIALLNPSSIPEDIEKAKKVGFRMSHEVNS